MTRFLNSTSRIKPRDRIRDGDTLGCSEGPYLDALCAETAYPDAPDSTDRQDRLNRSANPERHGSSGPPEPSDPSYGDRIKCDKERLGSELMEELASLEAQQAELRRRIGASTAPDPEVDSGACQDGDHPASFAGLAYGSSEVAGSEIPMGGRRPVSPIRSVVLPVAFALALPMFAGAVAVQVFAPTDQPAAVIADNGSQIVEPNGLAVASSAVVEPTAEAPPKSAPQDSIVAAGARPSNIAPQNRLIGTVAPIAGVRVASEGGVTMLQRRDPRPIDVAPGVAPIRRAIVNSASPEASAPPVATAKTPRFAPLDHDAELLQSTVPSEVIALAPAHFPPAAQLKALRPIGFAPTSKVDTIEQEPPPPSITGNVEMPSQPTQTARATVDVNMRAGPNNDEPVVTVVLAEEPIEVVECKAWCDVVFDGHRGWIHNKFVDRSGPVADSDNWRSEFAKNPIAAAVSYIQSLELR